MGCMRLSFLLCAVLPAALFCFAGPASAGVKLEKKPKMTMAERKEQARQAAEARREQSKQRAEERRLKNRSKAEMEADEQAAQEEQAHARHAAELEEAAEEERRSRIERDRAERRASQAHSAAVQERFRNRKEAIARFDVRKGDEWTTTADGMKLFRLLDEAQQYVRLAAEEPDEAKELLEEWEDDTMIVISKGAHLTVKATNADSLLPSVGDIREAEEGSELAKSFDSRTAASVTLKNAAEERGLIRVRTRRKEEFWVLYRDLLEHAAAPEREEATEEEEQPAEEEERDTYEYGDDLI